MCQLKDPLVSPIMALVFWHFLVATNLILYQHENCLISLCCSMFPMQTMQFKHIIFTYDFADFLRSRALSNCVQRMLCFLSWKHSHTRALFCYIMLFATCEYRWSAFEVDELNVCLYSGSRLTVILSDELHFDTSRQGDAFIVDDVPK